MTHDAESKSYDDLLLTRDGLIEAAIEFCPWKRTDHWPETRRYNYCTWCDGWVTGVLGIQEEIRGVLDADPDKYNPLHQAISKVIEGTTES